MARVTVLGLGAMGSALARAFIGAGHDVTVWNRTVARAEPLVATGADLGRSAADAVSASPLTVLCIDNYGASRELIEDDGMLAALGGRVLVQLSTGTPNEARRLASSLVSHGVGLLDGAIMPYPEGIGADDAQILFSGPIDLFESWRPVLRCLGGDLRHVGEDYGSAAVLDMALLTHQLSNYLGVWHAALVCESERVGVDVLASLLPQDDPAAHLAWRIHERAFDDPGATLEVWNAALDRILEQARDAGINDEVPALVSSLFRRAIALGHGQRDVASVMEVLQARVQLGDDG